ncbi:MAG TPA: mechanosensitive ion channel family protein [Allosphingosinicella sp.]|jgi:small-conductance mechanosensitive channel
MAKGSLGERSARVVRELSDWVTNNSADVALALVAALAITLLLIGLRAFGHRLVRTKAPDVHWRIIFGRVLSKTSLFFVIMCAVELVAAQTAAPYAIRRTAEILFIVAAAFQAAVWTRELILGFVAYRVGDAEDASNLGSALGIIRLLVTVTLFAVALILILDNLGVNVTGLVAGLGIGGIAIGLAAQGIFSDLFAALSILFDKPFRKGDAIRVGQIVGTVEYIGLKTTRLRSLEGEQVVISNAKLLDQQLHNFARLERRRFTLRFGLAYQIPPETLRAVPEMVRGLVEGHEHSHFIRCGVAAYGASGLDHELVFEVESPDFEFAFATRHAIAVEILEAFARAGIAFAYPTQIAFTAAPDGTLVMPYPDENVADRDRHPGEGRDLAG